jgi:hypothetical protein
VGSLISHMLPHRGSQSLHPNFQFHFPYSLWVQWLLLDGGCCCCLVGWDYLPYQWT